VDAVTEGGNEVSKGMFHCRIKRRYYRDCQVVCVNGLVLEGARVGVCRGCGADTDTGR